MARGRSVHDNAEYDGAAIPTMVRCRLCGRRFYGAAVDRCLRCRLEQEQLRARAAAPWPAAAPPAGRRARGTRR